MGKLILLKDTFYVPLWNITAQDTILSHHCWFYQWMTVFLQQRQEKCAPCTGTAILVPGLDMICTWENSEKKRNKTSHAISK